MGKLEGIIKDEIVRLAKREMRRTFVPLRRDVRSLKIVTSELRKSVSTLQRFVTSQEKQMGPKPIPEVTPEDIKKARLSPRLIKTLRKRLGVSQRDLARLAGVTVGAVYQWESGKFEPWGEKKKILVGLRTLGRQNAKRLLAEKPEQAMPTKKRTVSRRRKGKAPLRRVETKGKEIVKKSVN